MTPEQAKQATGERAAELIEPGMRVGLGTGSTANFFIDALAARKLDIVCVATSRASAERGKAGGLRLSTLDETPELDLTVDGADEIGPGLSLVKGGGGALLYEKIVAKASKQMIVIADESKCVPVLGQFPLPVEVIPFGLEATKRVIAAAFRQLDLNGALTLRQNKNTADTFVTEAQHFIFDAHLSQIPDPEKLAQALSAIPGVVEHGLFLNIANLAIIAGPNGAHEIVPDRLKRS